jgi:hypothetical protein
MIAIAMCAAVLIFIFFSDLPPKLARNPVESSFTGG